MQFPKFQTVLRLVSVLLVVGVILNYKFFVQPIREWSARYGKGQRPKAITTNKTVDHRGDSLTRIQSLQDKTVNNVNDSPTKIQDKTKDHVGYSPTRIQSLQDKTKGRNDRMNTITRVEGLQQQGITGVKTPHEKQAYWSNGQGSCKTGQPECTKKQLKQLTGKLKNGLISLTPPTEPWEESLPLEKTLLRHKPLVDHLKAGTSSKSSMKIIGRNSGFKQGDNVTIMVTVRDGYGKACQQGGDQIRVWMTNTKLKASLAPEVDDLGNGSYVAVLPLPWAGSVTVKASLVYNAAVQRAHYYARNVIGSTRYVGAGFRDAFKREVTLCSPFPKILRYAKLCNFTEENGGMSWFCGSPSDETLSCRHYKSNYDFDFVKPLPSTPAEKQWWAAIAKKYNVRKLTLLPSNINIVVAKTDNVKPREKPSCKTIPWEDTWKSKAPRGYFFNTVWNPSTCTLNSLTKDQITKCFYNTTVLALGDSNVMGIFVRLSDMIGCKPIMGKAWHSPRVCRNNHTVIRWQSHGHPFHVGGHIGADRTDQKASSQYIDEIPSQGRFLVILHLFVHYTAYRDHLFIAHIRAIRVAVEKLLQRNSNVKVAIRGTHPFQQYWYTPRGGDIVSHAYTSYIQNEFEGLKDRVVFVQPWDMTVAAENGGIHPTRYVTKALVDVMLSHVCPDV